jgi:hypothetical protein
MKCNIPNRKSTTLTPEEEVEYRNRLAESLSKTMKIILKLLIPLLDDLPDPRDQRYIRYSKQTLYLYGIMMFVTQMPSRRDANRRLTHAIIQKNLRIVIPELKSVPHADTLAKFLKRVGSKPVQDIYERLLKKLFKNKEFKSLAGRFTVLVDGSGKSSRDWNHSDKALHRTYQDKTVYFTYVMQAVMILSNGMVIPLGVDFLENTDNKEFDKQDCELKAWYRMAPKLHKLIGNDAIIMMDSLYACGPVITICKKYNWDYVIVLKDGSMKSFVEDAHGIMKCEPSNCIEDKVDGRDVVISWANEVEYKYSNNNSYMKLEVLRMVESWIEHHPNTKKPSEPKEVTYQWISSFPLSKENALQICILGRKRWLIENNFLTEKHGGYAFEHDFSLDWDVNISFHIFMNIGHFINTMLMSSEHISPFIAPQGGIRGFINKVFEMLSGFVLDACGIAEAIRFCHSFKFNPISYYILWPSAVT